MRKIIIAILSTQFSYLLIIGFYMSLFNAGYAQTSQGKVEQYLTGNEKKIEMIVHIWGEVKNPGEYRVSDDTNVLELISKAGGPTEYSNLKNVTLTREVTPTFQISARDWKSELIVDNNQPGISAPSENSTNISKRVLKINLKHYLENPKSEELPVLQPGDIIRIERNSWFRWQAAIRLTSQIAIVFQAMYYFSRIE